MVLETIAGQLVNIEVNISATYGYDVRGELVGEKGTAFLRAPVHADVNLDLKQINAYPADWRPRFADAYRLQNYAWVKSINTGKPNLAPAPGTAIVPPRLRKRASKRCNRQDRRRHADRQNPDSIRESTHENWNGLRLARAFAAMTRCWTRPPRLGIAGIEFNACNWTSAPHFDLAGLLDAGPREIAAGRA